MSRSRSRMLMPAVAGRWVLAGLLAAAGLGATACGGTGTAAPSATHVHRSAMPADTHSASPAGGTSAAGTVIKVVHTSLGMVLTDGKGITVYLFEKDTSTKSTCYGTCAAAWPPVLTTGTPVAGPGARASLLGTTIRTGGMTQITYAGHPLYYFSASTKPGQVNGQGVNGFGAHWDAVRPTGAQAG